MTEDTSQAQSQGPALPTRRKEITQDPLLDDLVPDPANLDARRITGFLLGRSSMESRWRLYMSVNLNHYIEFDKEDTLDAQQFRPSRTVVWLKPNARIHEIKTQSAPIEFLQGEIRNGFLRGTSGVPRVLAAAGECPGSGCAHCSVACSQLPGGGSDTVGYTCGC